MIPTKSQVWQDIQLWRGATNQCLGFVTDRLQDAIDELIAADKHLACLGENIPSMIGCPSLSLREVSAMRNELRSICSKLALAKRILKVKNQHLRHNLCPDCRRRAGDDANKGNTQ